MLSLFIFSVPVLFAGIKSGLFEFNVLDSSLVFMLPFTLFVFPAFLEEAFFRGVFIPVDSMDRGKGTAVVSTAVSSILFTLWHPLNALTVNSGAQKLFLDPLFLLITLWLGVVCSIAYIKSRSLWVPVIIHWAAVLVWVVFLNGRNLIIE